MYKKIAIVKERQCPEDPKGLEHRLPLLPKDVKKLVNSGVEMFVEENAGVKLNINDAEYISAGANIEKYPDIYSNKNLILQFKGLSMDSIPHINAGTTVMCMAHTTAFQFRTDAIRAKGINLIAMENILTDKNEDEQEFLDRTLVTQMLHKFKHKDVIILNYNNSMRYPVKYISRCLCSSLLLVSEQHSLEYINNNKLHNETILIDSDRTNCANILNALPAKHKYINIPKLHITYNRDDIKPLVKRKIEYLHGTGMSGAEHGMDKFSELNGARVKEATVIGYGNVALGAIDACISNGVAKVNVLNKYHTKDITNYIKNQDLIINGVDMSGELRGKRYVIANKHLENLQNGSVIIDLVGGSNNKGAIEFIKKNNYLDNIGQMIPEFNIYTSALWGWPLLNRVMQSNKIYSEQILDTLIGSYNLIDGIENSNKSELTRALVVNSLKST